MVRTALGSRAERDQVIGVALILATAALFGSGFWFARIAYDAGMSPLPLLTWRYVFAALVGWLLVSASRQGRRSLLVVSRRGLAALLGLGILYVGNAGAYTAALEHTPASLVAIITYLYPAMVAVISMRYARRLEGRRAWVALALSTAGVALAVGGIPADAQVPVSGILLALTCAVCYAVWIVLAARLRGERPGRKSRPTQAIAATGPEDTGAAAQGPDALAASAVMSTTTALTAAVLALLMGGDPSPTVVPGPAWPALVGFGLFSGIAVVTFLAGTRRIGAARAALVSTVEPVYTIVLATLLLDETLDPVQVLGGTLVVCGVLLAESGRPRRPSTEGVTPAPGAVPEALDRATV